ncbi:MAG: tetratricopeptide repeat protein [Blastocatellia bacterium]
MKATFRSPGRAHTPSRQFPSCPPALSLALLLMLCLMLLPPRRDHVAYAGAEVRASVQTRHFFLVGNASEKDIRQAGLQLEQFREIMHRLFPGASQAATIPIHVLVFRNPETMAPFLPERNGRTNVVGGYFLPRQDISYIALHAQAGGASPYATIFHEYTHAVTNGTMGQGTSPLPLWLSEGLAEYYSAIEVAGDGRQVTIGKPIPHHLQLLREGRLLPLHKLFAIGYEAAEYNETEKRGLLYAQSWALVHYLSQSARREQFAKFIAALYAGTEPGAAYISAFDTDHATMEQELREYLRADKYPGSVLGLDRGTGAETAMTSASLGEAEWNYHLGDLLRQQGRPECAQYLQRALRLEPDLAAAHTSLGMLAVYQGKLGEARAHFQKAIAAPSFARMRGLHHLAHYYYAAALTPDTTPGAETLRTAREQLQKAIAINPAFPDAYALLAHLDPAAGESPDTAIALLKKATALAPARQDLILQLATAYMRADNFTEARRLVTPLTREAGDPQNQSAARQTLDAIESGARYKTETGAIPRDAFASAPVGPTGAPGLLERQAVSLRRRADRQQISGTLTDVSCDASGITLRLRDGQRTLQFHARSLQNISMINSTTRTMPAITCEPLSGPLPVTITYRPGNDTATNPPASYTGEPIAVEFLAPESN